MSYMFVTDDVESESWSDKKTIFDILLFDLRVDLRPAIFWIVVWFLNFWRNDDEEKGEMRTKIGYSPDRYDYNYDRAGIDSF